MVYVFICATVIDPTIWILEWVDDYNIITFKDNSHIVSIVILMIVPGDDGVRIPLADGYINPGEWLSATEKFASWVAQTLRMVWGDLPGQRSWSPNRNARRCTCSLLHSLNSLLQAKPKVTQKENLVIVFCSINLPQTLQPITKTVDR